MKRIILLALICSFSIFPSFAQNDEVLVNKKGKRVLPEQGDFSIGIGANSIFNFAGNLFNEGIYNQLEIILPEGNMISMKYFLSSKNAIRLKLGVNNHQNSYSNKVTNDLNPSNEVTDELLVKSNYFQLKPGFERRLGNSRFQQYIGIEGTITISNTSWEYTYGNSFSETNPAPTSTTDFPNPWHANLTERKSENYSGPNIQYGARAFIGIEYFLLPKFSIGTEIGLFYEYGTIGKFKTVMEYWDHYDSEVKTDTESNEGNVSSQTGIDILQGQLFFQFYF